MPAEPPDAEPPDAEPPDDELPDTEPPATTGRVLVVGDLVTDVLAVVTAPLAGGAGLAVGSDTRARIRFAAGGSAANTASWLADARIPVTLVAAVGDDAAGRDR
ncbi:MAG: PfkB family carbohydrate kinase, partial [Actinocatenispora sp.]